MELRKHPDSPDVEELAEIVVEAVPREDIERRRSDGQVLVEDNVREREDLNVTAYLSHETDGTDQAKIGVGLYRLVQLFGTPQFPEYDAGEDISWRTDETFKYLFRATHRGDHDELPSEWLMTVHDSHVRFAASVAEWREDDEAFTADSKLALTTYALAQQLAADPVECVYEDIPF